MCIKSSGVLQFAQFGELSRPVINKYLFVYATFRRIRCITARRRRVRPRGTSNIRRGSIVRSRVPWSVGSSHRRLFMLFPSMFTVAFISDLVYRACTSLTELRASAATASADSLLGRRNDLEAYWMPPRHMRHLALEAYWMTVAYCVPVQFEDVQ